MCYGYHMRLTPKEEAELLKQKKKMLEDRIKDLDQALADLQKQPAPQAA